MHIWITKFRALFVIADVSAMKGDREKCTAGLHSFAHESDRHVILLIGKTMMLSEESSGRATNIPDVEIHGRKPIQDDTRQMPSDVPQYVVVRGKGFAAFVGAVIRRHPDVEDLARARQWRLFPRLRGRCVSVSFLSSCFKEY